MASDTLIHFDNLLRVLDEYRQAVIDLYRKNLQEDDHVASHHLMDNITYLVNRGNREIEVDLRLSDYWKYVENGTRPHYPPIKPILDWVKVKFKGNPPNAKTYDGPLPSVETLENQFAHAVQHSIGVKGTEGTHDLQETLQQVNQRFEYKIGEAILQDLDDMMLSIITEFNMK